MCLSHRRLLSEAVVFVCRRSGNMLLKLCTCASLLRYASFVSILQ